MTRHHTILGISPGTRQVGIAVLRGRELRDWGVRGYKDRWSPSKLRRIVVSIEAVVDRWQPDIVAVKTVHPSRSSPRLDQLLEALRQMARDRGILLRTRGIDQIQAYLMVAGRRPKTRLAERVAGRHPILYAELAREKGLRHPYHMPMFEAVAIAETFVSPGPTT